MEYLRGVNAQQAGLAVVAPVVAPGLHPRGRRQHAGRTGQGEEPPLGVLLQPQLSSCLLELERR